jgi:signal peptidase II
VHGLQAARGASAVEAAPASSRSTEDQHPNRRSLYAILIFVAAVVVALDQVTKELALRSLSDGPVDVIEGVLRWRLAFNPGGAFGLFQEHSEIFLVATLVVVVAILVWVRNLDDPRLIVPLGLIVGGGLGNVFDRIFRDLDGRVVDFIDLHVWPVFNVADMGVVLGVLAILVLSFRSEER